jgi:type IV secretory pathway VirB2 component (pilin)
MYRNYLKIAFRNLLKNKASTLINIGGLAVGMAVAILIGLWIWDELSYDRYHANYERIAQVMQHNVYNGVVETQVSNPALMAEEIRDKYGSDFKYVLQSSWNGDHTLAHQDKKLLKPGSYFEPSVTEMLSLKMLRGTRDGLKEPYTILLSAAVAKAFFGDADPMGKMFKVDNQAEVKVTGKLATFFAILAIFISCLGLFGLASFVAEQRTKEIGVRKVLGATILSVWGLLSKEFVALVLISCVLAIPLSYYYLHGWLQQFEYRTSISWWIFVAAVLGALLITLLTVSYQAIRAALANPVKSLRSE